MPECYKCRDSACRVEFSQMPTCTGNGSCFTQTKIHENDRGEQILGYERGCENYGAHAQFSMCNVYHVTAKHLFHDLHLNCCDTNKCNDVSFKLLELARPYTNPKSSFLSIENNGIGILLTGSSFIIISILLLIFGSKYIKKRRAKKNKNNNEYDYEVNSRLYCDLDEISPKKDKKKKNSKSEETTFEIGKDVDLSSGVNASFSERTLSKDIKPEAIIGNGRYGKVWRAKWKNNVVAVKIFFSQDYISFKRELDIYKAMNSSISPHILNFLGSDITSNIENACTELWLVTKYCKLGSLFDYLSKNTLTLESALSIINSILSGIFYLHEDMYESGRKPAIAHRDIKSKNILMENPTECVIADFGLAVTHHKGGEFNFPVNYQVGTKRYMAPELLNSTFNPTAFESYLMADVYSVGLVLWEVVNRIEMLPDIKAQEFRVAYQEMVDPDPSFEDMNHVVCKLNCRPKIESSLLRHKVLSGIARMIQESWAAKPMSRLTIFYMKKYVARFQQ